MLLKAHAMLLLLLCVCWMPFPANARPTNGPRRGSPKRLVESSQLLKLRPTPGKLDCDHIRIVVGIMSVDKDRLRRQWVRNSYKQYSNVYNWRSNPQGSVAIVFVLGYPPNNTQNAGALMEEAEKYGDMVFLNTPEAMNEGKTYEWLVKAWELYGSCPKLKYIAKGDQDAYIRTHKLEAKWLSVKKDNVYYGWTVNVSSSYNGRAFNYSFAVGMLYGLSKKLVHHIATSAVARKEKAGAEDMKTGYWLAADRVPVHMVHDESFHDWVKTDKDGADWAWKPVTEASTVVHHVYNEREFAQLWSRWVGDGVRYGTGGLVTQQKRRRLEER